MSSNKRKAFHFDLDEKNLKHKITFLPLIVTENSGINDTITNGQERFIIPIQSTTAMVDKMGWFIHHPEQIEATGMATGKMALNYT